MHRKMNKQVGGEEQQINNLRRGLWTEEEDRVLSEYMRVHGGGRWSRIPKITGLKRCGKSCRLRWLNYLSPTVKRGGFSEEEEDLIIRLHKLLGNRWSLIAGRVPGRTDNQVKNHWNTHLSKRLGIKNQIKSKIRMNKQLSTVGACSSSHHHHHHHHQPDDEIDHDQNPSSGSSVLNSRFNLHDQQQDSSKDKDSNNNNYLEQDDDHVVNYAENNSSSNVDREEDQELLMTSRLSESSYSYCYDDGPRDDSLLLSTRHSHLDNFFEFFDSSTLDVNQVL